MFSFNIMIAFVIGFIACLLLIYTLFKMVFQNVLIYKADYKLVYRVEDGEERVLNTFSRYYWKKETHQADIKALQRECENIRNNVLTDEFFLLTLIDENFELDLADVHLVHAVSYEIKPR